MDRVGITLRPERAAKLGKLECWMGITLPIIVCYLSAPDKLYFMIPAILGSVYLYHQGAGLINASYSLGAGDGKIPTI
ncbi:hypothetical protein A2379_01265 [Candidatus Amesbacteria bacterium RIFOXYB1_FULL_47_13]|nr:MAG: hypothetical protein A2379_01265 [Candidatus Amesbacteria bacterium RIFOXYB1_FULL_47_13]HBC73210.1 hypothetical protein [Candidatus Amesbacteria bacterium]